MVNGKNLLIHWMHNNHVLCIVDVLNARGCQAE